MFCLLLCRRDVSLSPMTRILVNSSIEVAKATMVCCCSDFRMKVRVTVCESPQRFWNNAENAWLVALPWPQRPPFVCDQLLILRWGRRARLGLHANSHELGPVTQTFAIDITICPQGSGPLTILSALDDPIVIAKILAHLGLPPRALPKTPARFDEFQQTA